MTGPERTEGIIKKHALCIYLWPNQNTVHCKLMINMSTQSISVKG